jgi:glycosyltransferase involved in cell wall biosynthesis
MDQATSRPVSKLTIQRQWETLRSDSRGSGPAVMADSEATVSARGTAIFPISAVVATINRALVLKRTLESLRAQGMLPAELIVIDASFDDLAKKTVEAFSVDVAGTGCRVVWQEASTQGAAAQRNQGVAVATQPVIAFFDDDIMFHKDCIARLWRALQSDSQVGGVSAMITNQRYPPPSAISRLVFRIMAGRSDASYAGRVLGPAVNLLPEDRDDLPDIVPVEWLNTTCTIYRREALPNPVFPSRFKGYSLAEDLTLSLTVGRDWKLANARTARIYHDSQAGNHKNDRAAVSRMELANRHFVMVHVLGRCGAKYYAKFLIWELFQLVSTLRQSRGRMFWQTLWGKLLGARDILRGGD